MKIRKILLLASMALAAVALAAPAAQANDTWTTDGEPIPGEGNPTTVEVNGELSSTVLGVTTGPAVVHGHGDIWNGENMGEGKITKFTITGSLSVSPLPHPCTATGTANVPWSVTATTGVVDINAHFTNHYNATCQAFGLPATATAHGTATGTVEGNCLNFVNAGDMTTSGGQAVKLNGKVCMADVDAEGNTTEGVIGTVPME